MACSMPPMYWSTGMKCRAMAGIEGPVLGPRVAEAQEVPRRVDEGVHGVGLALGRAPADGARRMTERRVPRQGRLAGGEELDVVGSEDGQLVLGNADDPVDRGSRRRGSGIPRSAGARPASPASGS